LCCANPQGKSSFLRVQATGKVVLMPITQASYPEELRQQYAVINKAHPVHIAGNSARRVELRKAAHAEYYEDQLIEEAAYAQMEEERIQYEWASIDGPVSISGSSCW